jgi:hypothetical protein
MVFLNVPYRETPENVPQKKCRVAGGWVWDLSTIKCTGGSVDLLLAVGGPSLFLPPSQVPLASCFGRVTRRPAARVRCSISSHNESQLPRTQGLSPWDLGSEVTGMAGGLLSGAECGIKHRT